MYRAIRCVFVPGLLMKRRFENQVRVEVMKDGIVLFAPLYCVNR